jgi:hypothetical protein
MSEFTPENEKLIRRILSKAQTHTHTHIAMENALKELSRLRKVESAYNIEMGVDVELVPVDIDEMEFGDVDVSESAFNPRFIANMKLLDILKKVIKSQPDIRFSQALCNLSMVVGLDSDGLPCEAWKDEFYLESADLLKRVRRRKKSK